MNQGDLAKAIALVDEVLPVGRRVENPSRTALLLAVRGLSRLYTARGPARADLAEALAVARTANDPLVLGYVQEHYGALQCLDGDLGQARALHEETLTIARSLGDENLCAEAHYVLAIDAIAAHDAGSAAPQLAAAVQHYKNLDHFQGLARCLGALSALALEGGDPHLAARLIGTATAVRDRFGLRPWPWAAEAEQPTIKQAAALLPDGEYARGLAWMFRTQSAQRPRWATSQKTSPSRPSHTGVRRGCPVRRPVVSSRASPGGGGVWTAGGRADACLRHWRIVLQVRFPCLWRAEGTSAPAGPACPSGGHCSPLCLP